MSMTASTQRTDPQGERPAPPAPESLAIPPIPRRSRWTRLLVVLLLAGGGAGAYFFMKEEVVPGEKYRTATADKRDIVRMVDATGSLDVRRRVAIPAPVPGRLTEINVGVRDQVKQGQVLGKLDARAATLAAGAADAEVGAAEGRVRESRAALEAAKRERERAERLLERGLVSRQEADAARTRESQAIAAVDAARGALTVAQQGRAQARLGAALTDITAPEDGVVMLAPEAVGAAVAPDGLPLFVLGSTLEEMRVEARVGEADIGAVQVGQEAEFEVLAYPGRRFPAKVVGIGLEPVRDGALVYYPVGLQATNTEGLLLPGMTASVHMKVAEEHDVLSVPEAALRFTPEDQPAAPPRTRVFLRTGPRTVQAITVEPGISDGAFTAVKVAGDAKLGPGDELAVGTARGGAGGEKPKAGISLGSK